jgi:hypothetical protein
MNIVDFYTLLIGVEGTKTPVGVRFRGDPAGVNAEEARRNAHGKRSAWSGNQQTSLTKPFFKTRLLKGLYTYIKFIRIFRKEFEYLSFGGIIKLITY